MLGELDSNNADSWLQASSSPDQLDQLQFLMTNNDRQLWDHMDLVAFDVIESLRSPDRDVEYWSSSKTKWVASRPALSERRSSVLVHEACLTPAGGPADRTAVDDYYRLHSCDNVVSTLPSSPISLSSTDDVIVRYWSWHFPHCWQLESCSCSVRVCPAYG